LNKDNNTKKTIKAHWYKYTVANLNHSYNTNNKKNINICTQTFNEQLRLNISISAATNYYEGNLKKSNRFV